VRKGNCLLFARNALTTWGSNASKKEIIYLLVQDEEQVRHVCGTLADELKEKKLALSTTQSSREFSSHGPSNHDAIGSSFVLVDFPIRESFGFKVRNLADRNVRPDVVILTNVGALMTTVHVIQECGLAFVGVRSIGFVRISGGGEQRNSRLRARFA